MNSNRTNIVRVLIASSGLLFVLSSVTKEWKVGIPATVLLISALICAVLNMRRDTSQKRLEQLLKKGNGTSPDAEKTPNQAMEPTVATGRRQKPVPK